MSCPDDRKFAIVQSLVAAVKRKYQVIDVDGARVLFPAGSQVDREPAGWGLVRASNTQPALVLRAEARTQEALERIKSEIETELRQFPEVAAPAW